MQCYHCGLPATKEFSAVIAEQERFFCCAGCEAVATLIAQGGFEDFYRYRDEPNQKPEEQAIDFSAFDSEAVQQDFVTKFNETNKQASLYIEGIHCAACAWLIENYLGRFPAIQRVSVNVSNHLCTVEWHSAEITLSEIMSTLDKLGYSPQPAISATLQKIRKKEKQQALLRLAVAGLGMMQVGMVAIALHAGDIQGMQETWRVYLRWISLVMATPVVFFSAKPFFSSALRALKNTSLNMDVPVSLAIGLAYGASLVATIWQIGEVYFDSVSMFTFFLLLGRYLEMLARHRSASDSERLSDLLPSTVQKYEGDELVSVPLKLVCPGDEVRVESGKVIPCDGILSQGQVSVDESLLTGESIPQQKTAGQPLVAGSVNGDSPLRMRVTAVGSTTGLAAIERYVNDAATQKPKQVYIADRLARKFVAAVLIVSVLVGCMWLYIDPSKAFWVVLSVLVVTCPCALSLATPAALTAGTGRLRQLGLLVAKPGFIETLPLIDTVVFDKTGTLTEGRLSVKRLVPLAALDETRILDIVAALEDGGSHPIALAFKDHKTPLKAQNIVVHPASCVSGAGVSGTIDNKHYRFGTLDFALNGVLDTASATQVEGRQGEGLTYPSSGLWQLLADQNGPLAWLELADRPRAGVGALLASLRTKKMAVLLASGDREVNVREFARQHGIEHARGALSAQDKLAWVQARQKRGEVVMVVGDGINDAPLLAGGDVSLAMASASQLTKTKADATLLNTDLAVLLEGVSVAAAVRQRIRQNLAWALGYNALVLPLAAAALVPPYLAAIGMSLSSLVVVLNSLRPYGPS